MWNSQFGCLKVDSYVVFFFFWLFQFSLVCWLILPHFAVLNFSFTLLFSDTLDGQKIEGERRRKAIKTSRPKEKSPRKLRRTVACPYVPKKKKEKPCIYGLDGGRVFYQPHYIPHINSIQTAALYVFYVFLDLWVAMTRNWRGQRRVESVAAASIFVDTTNTLAPTEI